MLGLMGKLYDRRRILLNLNSFNGLLDLFPNASIGYSLRQLRAGHTTGVIRVRRSSDNAELDFKANEITDGTLTTWTGSGDGFVTKWYDQSSNGNDAVQTTASKQPTIVRAGVLLTNNGKPAINFPNGLLGDLNFNTVSQSTVITVAKMDNINSINYLLWNESDKKGFFQGGTFQGINGLGLVDGSIKFITGQNLDQNMAWFNYNGTNYDVAQNGNTITALSNGNNFALESIGRPEISVVQFSGSMQEIILYPSEQSGNKAGIETNINNHYSIY